MKADRTTEKFSIDSLTGASADRSIKCPDGFGHELSDMIDSLDAAERIIISGESKDRNTWHWLAGVAACIAIIAGILLYSQVSFYLGLTKVRAFSTHNASTKSDHNTHKCLLSLCVSFD